MSPLHNPPPNQLKPKTTNRRRWQLLMSYAPDWILTIGATGVFYLLDGIEGFRRRFSLTDTSIQYPYAEHDRIPMWMLLIISAACPLVIMPCINLVTVRTWWDWHNSWLGLALAMGLTGTLTNIIKITAGRPRPDMLARCLPREGSIDAPVFGLVDSSICTRQNVKMMRDAFRSFVSGHASLSAAGLGFLFFYLAGKLHLFDKRGNTFKAWIAAAPLTGVILVPITRTMDYRHHWSDAFIGSLLGFSIAYFSYRQYYPSLESPLSHRPYSPRIPREEMEVKGIQDPSIAEVPSRESGNHTPRDECGEEGTVQRQNLEVHEIYENPPERANSSIGRRPTKPVV